MKTTETVCITVLIVVLMFSVACLYVSGLSDETQELVEDLRWKHYPFASVFTQPDVEWWAQQYPYIMFDDGTLYIVDEDVTWFIEMERKKDSPEGVSL